MSSAAIDLHRNAIADFCRHWHIAQLCLFGSVLREDFSPESDVDVLVTFSPDFHYGILDLIRMKAELKAIFGRDVDLVDRRVLEESPNYIRRRHILESAETIYGS